MITPEEREELDEAVGNMMAAYGSWWAAEGSVGSDYRETVVKYYAVLDRLTEGN